MPPPTTATSAVAGAGLVIQARLRPPAARPPGRARRRPPRGGRDRRGAAASLASEIPTSATDAWTSSSTTTGDATPEVPIRHSSWEKATPHARIAASCSRRRFGRTTVRPVNGCNGSSPSSASSSSAGMPGQQRLADRRRVQRHARAAHPRDLRHLAAGDLLDDERAVAGQDREVHDPAALRRERVQVGHRDDAELAQPRVHAAEREQARGDLEARRGVVEQPELLELPADPVQRRLRQPGAGRQLRERQRTAARSAVLEHDRHALGDRPAALSPPLAHPLILWPSAPFVKIASMSERIEVASPDRRRRRLRAGRAP